MKDSRYIEIKELVERFDSLPDGAFVAILAEHGVDADDLLAFANERGRRERRAWNEQRKRSDAVRAARRR